MATFAFSGRTRAGQTITGERAADTMEAAVDAAERFIIKFKQGLAYGSQPLEAAP